MVHSRSDFGLAPGDQCVLHQLGERYPPIPLFYLRRARDPRSGWRAGGEGPPYREAMVLIPAETLDKSSYASYLRACPTADT